ncbi:MAG: type II toxin-antitoxin system Phd/YefM family antitoxin [Rhizomicrobium sp.]
MTFLEKMPMSASTWTVAEAKAGFSELLDRAQSQGPQTITQNGQKVFIVVSTDEWQRKIGRKGNLADFFAASPLRGSKTQFVRRKGGLGDSIL